MKLRRTTEDYLKTIYLLSQKTEVHGAYIAEALGVSKPTGSVSLKGLEKEGYLFLDDDHEVHLTRLGQKVAQATYGRHQTFQTLLENLGVDGKTAAADACRMEHAVSPESYQALKEFAEGQKSTVHPHSFFHRNTAPLQYYLLFDNLGAIWYYTGD